MGFLNRTSPNNKVANTNTPGALSQRFRLRTGYRKETHFPYQLLSHLSRSVILTDLLTRTPGAVAATRATPVMG